MGFSKEHIQADSRNCLNREAGCRIVDIDLIVIYLSKSSKELHLVKAGLDHFEKG
jgi:hypothetical protein